MDIRQLVCAVCGHEWSIRAERPNPLRCPALKCRSTRWESGKDSRSGVKVLTTRVSEDQAGQFERAAKSAGKNVSEWLRDLGAAAVALPPTMAVDYTTRAAELDRLNNDQKDYIENRCATGMGFYRVEEESQPIHTDGPHLKKQVMENLMEIPGLRTGRTLFKPEQAVPVTGYVGKIWDRVEELRASDGGFLEETPLEFPADTPEEPVKSWLEELLKLAVLEEGDANEELLRLTSGDRPPSKYAQWHGNPKVRRGLASWLDEHDYPLTDEKEMGW